MLRRIPGVPLSTGVGVEWVLPRYHGCLWRFVGVHARVSLAAAGPGNGSDRSLGIKIESMVGETLHQTAVRGLAAETLIYVNGGPFGTGSLILLIEGSDDVRSALSQMPLMLEGGDVVTIEVTNPDVDDTIEESLLSASTVPMGVDTMI